MSPKERFQILLEPDQLEDLRKLQVQSGDPVAWHVRKAIQAYLEAKRPELLKYARKKK